jgi:alpha-glucosidase
MTMVDTPDPVLGFIRSGGGERIACLFNMGAEAVSVPNSGLGEAEPLDAGVGALDRSQGAWRLGAHAARFLRLP